MDADEYIGQHGSNLTDAEKRYIKAFGAPTFNPGTAHNPSTPGLRVSGGNRTAHDGGAASSTVEPPHET